MQSSAPEESRNEWPKASSFASSAWESPEGEELELAPVLVVDGSRVLATPEELGGAVVTARVVGSELGPKIRGLTYKPKTNNRRRYGHRQHYATIEITSITAP